MRNILLSAALLLGIAPNVAAEEFDLSAFFAVSYNGTELADGATLEISDYHDMSDLLDIPGAVTYTAELKVTNLDILPAYIQGTLLFDQPSAAVYVADKSFWGDPQLCYSLTKAGITSGNCLEKNLPDNAGKGIFEVPTQAGGSFEWVLHLDGAQIAADETYRLQLQAMESNAPGAAPMSTPFTINLHFTNATAGVDLLPVDSDDAPAEYYDLQGRRVNSPSAGLYIVRHGDRTSKVVVK